MMIYMTSVFAVPVVLLVWAVDTYLFLAALRLVLARVVGIPTRSWFARLRQLTDGPAHWVASLVDQLRPGLPAWLPWALVIGMALIVRHVLIGLALAMT